MSDIISNPLSIKCPRDSCKCLIIKADTATLVQRTLPEPLPEIGAPNYTHPCIPQPIEEIAEDMTDMYWMLGDVMQFENVGVSRSDNGIVYLTCADCDLAPLGYCDTTLPAEEREYLVA
ncbi:hypothetical protein EV174_006504, partial [Coemansia sp. RSA 2320]